MRADQNPVVSMQPVTRAGACGLRWWAVADDKRADRISVERVMNAPAAGIFGLVSDPAAHVLMDGSGMLVAAPDARRVTAVGDTFVMDMDREPLGDLPMGKYTVTNTVTRFEQDKQLEWSVESNQRSPLGHVYGFELEPIDGATTRVTNYCDWSNLQPKLRDRVTFPVVPVAMLEQTLDKLQSLVEPG